MDPTELTPESLAVIRNSQPAYNQPQVTLQPVDHDPFAENQGDMPISPYITRPAGEVAKAVGQGMVDWARTPGAQMKPNPYPPGSEEWQDYENQKTAQANQWGPQTAMQMVGAGAAHATFGPASAGELGVAGGRLIQPEIIPPSSPAVEQAITRANAWMQDRALREPQPVLARNIQIMQRGGPMAEAIAKHTLETFQPHPSEMLPPTVIEGSAGGRPAAKALKIEDGTSGAIQEGGSGARAAQGGPEATGIGAPDRGQSPQGQVGSEGVAGAAPGAGRLGGVDLQPADPKDFHAAISAAKAAHPQGSSVTLYPDYSSMKTFLTPDQKAGFALNGNDIVSVFRHPEGPRGVVGPILDKAVAEGGQRLDAFDTKLPELYGNHGFKAVSRTPFNDEFAPEGWDYAQYDKHNNGRPDVVAMVHDPAYGKPYKAGDGVMHPDYDSMIAAQHDAVFHDSPKMNAPFPQYAERYPETIPGQPAFDKVNDKFYMQKQNSPEAEDFAAKRAEIQKGMDESGYRPYFNPDERFHADPSQHPPMLDTGQQLPAKMETLENWTKKLDVPETRAALQKMYQVGQTVPNAQNWYMMGQLEREYIKEYGPQLGRQHFRNNFAGAMAATTGGADPTSNFLMAHYANYMRNKGVDFPRVTSGENQQVKDFAASQGRSYVDAKGNPVDKTGDIASYKLPYPIGGQYASTNLDTYKKVFDQVARGKDVAQELVSANPKRLDFTQSFLGHPDSFTWDKQMTKGTIGKDMPPKGTYGIMERIGREEAAKAGVPGQNFQDVAWAGQKKMLDEAKGKTFNYEGPMISHTNESIERTHQLTGMPRSQIVRRGAVRADIPMYGIGGFSAAALARAMQQRDQQ